MATSTQPMPTLTGLQNEEKSGNGHGRQVANRIVKVQYPSTLEGMADAMDAAGDVREALVTMGIPLTDRQATLRNTVLKYSERHEKAGLSAKPTDIAETIKRIQELEEFYDQSFEDAVNGADAVFSQLSSEIRREDAEVITAIEGDLARLWDKFRSVRTSDEMMEIAEAYAAVKSFLSDTLSNIRADKERRRLQQVAGRIQKGRSRL